MPELRQLSIQSAQHKAVPTLAVTAQRIREGEPVQLCLKECVDAWNATRQPSFFEIEPAATGFSALDAWMGGAAEIMAGRIACPVPQWTEGPGRFLDTPWFADKGVHAREIALIETPGAFRRRLVFCGITRIR